MPTKTLIAFVETGAEGAFVNRLRGWIDALLV